VAAQEEVVKVEEVKVIKKKKKVSMHWGRGGSVTA
jgi:hypothetical protein